MMRLYQWFVTVALLLGLSPALSVGQQWSGNSNTTDPIGRTGNVGIGTTSPSEKLDVQGGEIRFGYLNANNIHLGGLETDAGNTYLYMNTHYAGGWNRRDTGTAASKLSIGTNGLLLDYAGAGANPITWTRLLTVTTSGNVGIGTTGPAKKLDVIGDLFVGNGAVGRIYLGDQSSKNDYIENNDAGGGGYRFVADGLERVRIAIGGNIGIGTTGPTARLHIAQDAGTIPANAAGIAGLFSQTVSGIARVSIISGDTQTAKLTFGDTGDSDEGGLYWVNGAGDDDRMDFHVRGIKMSIKSNGNVGIGTTTPDPAYLLSVNGKIRAKEIKVETGWADEVFDEQYPLMSLSELEARIKQQKHLPGIPSAAEVEANGVNLGEMQTKLLQKIEELTLYMIALKKDNDALKTRMSALEQQNKP